MFRPRILIVEDESIIAMDLEARLTALGYEVVDVAASGRVALERATALKPDLVTMDIRIEGNMDGIETAALIREHLGLPVIFITAHGDGPTFERAKQTAPYGYVRKPFDDYELRTMIEIALYRHEVEQKLHESETRFRTLFEMMGQGVVFQNAQGEIVAANPAAQKILGLSLEQLQGRTSFDPRWHAIHEDGAEFPGDSHPAMVALRDGKEMSDVMMGVWHPKEEAYRWILVHAVPLFAPGAEQPREVFTSFEDITALCKAQEELQLKNRELSLRNDELDAFAHMVAHELKNPVGLIVGYSDFLLEEYEGLSAASINDMLQNISRYGFKLNTIIDELLLLASVRKQKVTTEPLDMAALTLEARQRVGGALKGRLVNFSTPETWPVALGYAPWVEEVWANYLSNAIKYGMPPSELEKPAQIELGATDLSNGMIRFWVRDEGRGLTPDQAACLFTPFTRLHLTLGTTGHGLGLSIVRMIIESLGGQVGVESVSGQGSTFFFTLPAARTEDTPLLRSDTNESTPYSPLETQALFATEFETRSRQNGGLGLERDV
ncbi:MAG: Sensor histidine kinase TmoS [Chloroflexi bacterium ADurb.Bin360]|nr:MAG: Sensor histidine kinase TmoS [Chloroflexi bacterium ADurb.Bin360]